jgi:MinD-like ATPase involved in chromosome partitioning or flagellar assembly/CheY-like chemotaxis protein
MTELTSALIVVVTDNSSQAERLRGILTAARYRVLRVSDFETAEARIAGGGVDLVVMRVSPDPRKTPVWDWIASLKKRTADLPVIVLCDDVLCDGEPNGLAIAHGASSSGMLRIVQEAGLIPTAHTLIERRRSLLSQSDRDGSAGIISLQGAKGGVGASTVALNLAAVLARHGKTIVAEMRPGLGTLASQFRLRRKVRTIADLAATSADGIMAADVEDCLWPCPEIPGLSVLFGPSSLECNFDWPARVSQILRTAARTVDYVVVDLPHCFSGVNRAALGATDYLLLVLERDALCLEAGKLMLGAMESENLLPHSTAAVVVSRVSLAAPVDLSAVERELNVPILGSVPPDPDLCLRAYQAQTAVVALDPESILAASYARLAEALPATLRVRHPRRA